jgi:hypothetical protein
MAMWRVKRCVKWLWPSPGDGPHGQGRIMQERARLENPLLGHVLVRRPAGALAERLGKVKQGHAGRVGRLGQRQVARG